MILSTRASTRAAPVAPSPVTISKTPSGRPARLNSSPSFKAISGVNSLGLSTTALPDIRAITISSAGVASGKFHGEMIPMTPSGLKIIREDLPMSPY
jgi:hypothetical protein